MSVVLKDRVEFRFTQKNAPSLWGLIALLIFSPMLTLEGWAEEHTLDQSDQDQNKRSSEGQGSEEEGFDEGGFDEGGFDEGGGFGELAEIKIKPSALPPPPSALRVDGFARSQWAAWTQRALKDSWAKGRQSLDLSAKFKRDDWSLIAEAHVEYDLLYDVSSDPFDPVQKEEYRSQYIPGIQSVSKRFSLGQMSVSLSTGRQIITWGESDGLSPLDVINPQDQREPGVAELDDMKLAVWLSRVQTSFGAHSIELIVRHEGHYGLLVPPQADYSPFNAIMADSSAMLPSMILEQIQHKEFRFAHEREGISKETQSFFARYQYRGEGFDLGLYAASLLDQQGVLSALDLGSLLDQNRSQFEINYDHPRFMLTGVTLALPLGSFLWKGEAVASIDKPVNVGAQAEFSQLEITEVNTLTAVSGLTYSGFTDTTLSLEYQKSFLVSDTPEKPFFVPPNLDVIALRAQRTFWRERLSASAVFTMIAPQWGEPSQLHQPQRGGLARVDLSYRLRDQVKLGLGYVHYFTGEDFGPFYGLESHDRLFAQLRWDFTLY